jgi:lysophospholipase L1-like esterase
MKLFSFGDSWTEGVGGDLIEEYTTNIPEERTKIRHKYAWPTYLAKELNSELQNDGVGATSNNAIFNTLTYKLRNNLITDSDFVIVMWSSTLRDSVPFFPSEDTFQFWGKRHKSKDHLYDYLIPHIINGEQIKNTNPEFRRAEKNYREFFYNNLFTDDYYDIVSQNYILYLQFILKELNIRYLFCDAFDLMVRKNITKSLDKRDLIDKSRYWGFGEKTMRDYLWGLNSKTLWEDGQLWTDKTIGKHPSKVGYKLIADELFKFISYNDLLHHKRKDSSFLI